MVATRADDSSGSGTAHRAPTAKKKNRRICSVDGCSRVVKSQGVCQRHGAKPTGCKVKGCTKQAQGNFDGMCKAHYAELKRTDCIQPVLDNNTSVYDKILPASVRTAETTEAPPIVEFLRDGLSKPPGWHRNQERQSRGYDLILNLSTPLEGWERELVCTETLLLTGVSEEAFGHLARAWGREPGFHRALSTSVLDRYRTRNESSGLSEEMAPATLYEGFLKTSLGDISTFTDIDEGDLAEFSRIISSSDQLPLL